MLGAVGWPAVTQVDGFPLSNYPMFSQPKPRVARIAHVIGFSSTGPDRPLPPAALGTDEIMQASQTVRRAIERGEADRLCSSTAATIANLSQYADIERLEVRFDWYDTVAYWKGERKPRRVEIAARCGVLRKAPS
jgi:hypothetical protein